MVLMKKRSKSFSEGTRRSTSLKSPALNRSPNVIGGDGVSDMKETRTNRIKDENCPVRAVSQPSLDVAAVGSGVDAVLKLLAAPSKQGVSLFSDEAQPILMQIASIKIAKTPPRQVRFVLPHSLITDNSDTCLIVSDLKKGKKEDHEPTVEHYTDLLEKNSVTGITQVIPVRQLKVEYDQYELKRRLCNQFDFFLADAKVSGHIRHLLGKEFVKKRKFPTPIKMNAKNLKEEIRKGLSKIVLHIHGLGNSYIVTVGHSKQSPEQIAENIEAVARGLALEFPGGWDNIRSLALKAAKSLPVPIYMTLKSPNEVDVPLVKRKRPHAAVPVEGELSTLIGARVTVLPSGKVIVTKDSSEEDSDTELNTFLESEREIVTRAKEVKKIRIKERLKRSKSKKKAISGAKVNSVTAGVSEEETKEEDDEEVGDEEAACILGMQKKSINGKVKKIRIKERLKRSKSKKKAISGAKVNSVTAGVSEEETKEEDDEEVGDEEAACILGMQKKSINGKDKRKQKSSGILGVKIHKKAKHRTDDDMDEEDDNAVVEAEAAYLSERYREQEATEEMKKSKKHPLEDSPKPKRKKKKLSTDTGKLRYFSSP